MGGGHVFEDWRGVGGRVGDFVAGRCNYCDGLNSGKVNLLLQFTNTFETMFVIVYLALLDCILNLKTIEYFESHTLICFGKFSLN